MTDHTAADFGQRPAVSAGRFRGFATNDSTPTVTRYAETVECVADGAADYTVADSVLAARDVALANVVVRAFDETGEDVVAQERSSAKDVQSIGDPEITKLN